jgi:glycerol uptake facilitator protein
MGEVKNQTQEFFAKARSKDPKKAPPPARYRYLAEIVGTYILILFGDGAICVAFLADTSITLFQIVMGWAAAVFLAIYIVGGISGAHINPAVTIPLALSGRMPKKDALPYIGCQMLGAFLGAATVYMFFMGPWNIRDPTHIEAALSQILNCHYPNPALYPDAYTIAHGGAATSAAAAKSWASAHFPLWLGFVTEVIMTFGLLLTVVSTTDPDSPQHSFWFAGMLIGLYVGFACFITPTTMTCINPARDWAPRFFGWLIGYGGIEFPGLRWEFPLIYGIPQILGGCLAVLFYDHLMKPYFVALKIFKSKSKSGKGE